MLIVQEVEYFPQWKCNVHGEFGRGNTFVYIVFCYESSGKKSALVRKNTFVHILGGYCVICVVRVNFVIYRFFSPFNLQSLVEGNLHVNHVLIIMFICLKWIHIENSWMLKYYFLLFLIWISEKKLENIGIIVRALASGSLYALLLQILGWILEKTSIFSSHQVP